MSERLSVLDQPVERATVLFLLLHEHRFRASLVRGPASLAVRLRHAGPPLILSQVVSKNRINSVVVLPPADRHEGVVIFLHDVLEEQPLVAKLARL